MTLSTPPVQSAAFTGAFPKTRLFDAAGRAPALLIALGAALSILYRAVGAPFMPAEWVASGADILLAALAFTAATQFRVSTLAKRCPSSFRLAMMGAPLYLALCAAAAFILMPNLPFASALLVAGALLLNGAAFDRRAVTDAPTPAAIKGAVRLESAAILALGVPVAILLEAVATIPADGMPPATPLLRASLSLLAAFGLGGVLGLAAALASKRMKSNDKQFALAAASSVLAFALAALFGANPIIAAAAVGLIWNEEIRTAAPTRIKARRNVERIVAPIAYVSFGVILGPRILQSDILILLFAACAVSVLRAAPRLYCLRRSPLPKESRAFLAWFGGAPGIASALFLISLLDAPSILAQEAVLTAGAVCVAFGVIAARTTSKPLLQFLIRETANAKKRRRTAY